ncbi:hypothetical protein L1987_81707 [Smallanthus sonchifolius]|uniref:Uncharacterized protein n=1 Tax=Smallanthus sonchifolius TaxID=185202 RepID=A0ACB8YSB1_9ASTR|nr:hypothetical protein L1987_81707 [Smallanthus sonchifolius]
MVMGCSGKMGFRIHFSGTDVSDGFRVFACLNPSVAAHSLSAHMISAPVDVGNPTAPCAVDGMVLNVANASLAKITLCFEFTGRTKNSIISVLVCFPSVSVTGNDICPMGCTISLEKPDMGAATGINRAWSSASSWWKHCSYMMSVDPPLPGQ